MTYKKLSHPIKAIYIRCTEMRLAFGMKKIRLSRLPRRIITTIIAHTSSLEDIVRTLRCRLFGSRQYKISPVPPSSSPPPPRPLSRAYHYHRRTLDGDKSCDRNDSAKLLLARIRARCLPCGSLHSRKSDADGGTQGLREGHGGGSEGYATFPHYKPMGIRSNGERQCPSRAVITHAFQ